MQTGAAQITHFFCSFFFIMLIFQPCICILSSSRGNQRTAERHVARGQAWKNNFTFANQMTFSSVPGGDAFYFGLWAEPLPLKDPCASKV